MRRPRRLVLSAAALGLALAATGCSYLNPIQTHEFYQAADGTNANLEGDNGRFSVGVRNVAVVLGEDGSATLYGAVVNYSGEDATVELEGTSEGTVDFSGQVPVAAGQTVLLGAGEEEHLVSIGSVGTPAGALMELTVTAGDQSTEISLPVLDTTLEYYGEDAVNAG